MSDTKFIQNKDEQSLLKRFKKVINQNVQSFDCVVGYFFTSGFSQICDSLAQVEKIRILVGINTDRNIVNAINKAQSELNFNDFQAKQEFTQDAIDELDSVSESKQTEAGIRQFIDFIKSNKLEIKAYPSANLHAKLYILTNKAGDADFGRVFTGSSNLTQSGLSGNLEFNVELKDSPDVKYAKERFEELWAKAIDVSEDYIQAITKKTWLNEDISPYELYMKFLYEYFREDLNAQKIDDDFMPKGFKRLKYQEDAVLNALRILRKHNGVFISDVVGLGKTLMTAMLAKQMASLNMGKTIIIAPPALVNDDNPNSWQNVFDEFHIGGYKAYSVGELDKIASHGFKYDNVIIDEAHRFRNHNTDSYEKLKNICYGKRVILVTATPLNNSIDDIKNQILLFQNPNQNTLPSIEGLNEFFAKLSAKLNGLDRVDNAEEYKRIVAENAKVIRNRILKHLMIRRTRREITEFYDRDIVTQGLTFPEVTDPNPIFYQLNAHEDEVFNQTIEDIHKLTYARYSALLYYKGTKPIEKQGQMNMRVFMKILLVKRMESSIEAFKDTVSRFIGHYQDFLNAYSEKGVVYVSSKHSKKIFEALDNDDLEYVDNLIEQGKAEKYQSEDFDEKLIKNIKADIEILNRIQALWAGINRDPKLLAFIDKLGSDKILAGKLIVFTESAVTAKYLFDELSKQTKRKPFMFTGASNEKARREVIQNFDANSKEPKDDFDILITTEVLAEGVNLHKSNVVINYDLPWNPTRMIQRVGRVNRVGTKFDKIYTYNFFPSQQLNDTIKLRESAEAKITAFIEMLGSDAKLLTEHEEVKAHNIFEMLTSKKTIEGEDEPDSELQYLNEIKELKEKHPEDFDKIKLLPKKARTAKNLQSDKGLLTFFRKGYLTRFYLSHSAKTKELEFIEAAKLLNCIKAEPKAKLPEDFYKLLEANRTMFDNTEEHEAENEESNRGRNAHITLRKLVDGIKTTGFSEDEEDNLKKLLNLLKAGALPTRTINKILKAIKEHKFENHSQLLAFIMQNIDSTYFMSSGKNTTIETAITTKEVILSEYLV